MPAAWGRSRHCGEEEAFCSPLPNVATHPAGHRVLNPSLFSFYLTRTRSCGFLTPEPARLHPRYRPSRLCAAGCSVPPPAPALAGLADAPRGPGDNVVAQRGRGCLLLGPGDVRHVGPLPSHGAGERSQGLWHRHLPPEEPCGHEGSRVAAGSWALCGRAGAPLVPSEQKGFWERGLAKGEAGQLDPHSSANNSD